MPSIPVRVHQSAVSDSPVILSSFYFHAPGLTAVDTRTTASMIDSSTCSDHGEGCP